jgi:two-component system, sensor histidine kinase
MGSRLLKLSKSFKSKLLLSFFALNRIFLFWICIYFYINHNQTGLDRFEHNLMRIQNRYAESNRQLQQFLLSGFHEPNFYATGHQKDIDDFCSDQDSIIQDLENVEALATDNHIDIAARIAALQHLHRALADSAKQIKQLYFHKGFRAYGSEGGMRKCGHFLEDSGNIPKMDILMLRRREKDFVLREDPKYIVAFNKLVDIQIKRNANRPATLEVLENYKKYFNEFADVAGQIGINSDHGTYARMEATIHRLDEAYLGTNAVAEKEVARLNRVFMAILVATFVLMLVAALVLSIVLANRLSKDIKILSAEVNEFAASGLTADAASQPHNLTSEITEIQGLHNDFVALKQNLQVRLSELEQDLAAERARADGLADELHKIHSGREKQ